MDIIYDYRESSHNAHDRESLEKQHYAKNSKQKNSLEKQHLSEKFIGTLKKVYNAIFLVHWRGELGSSPFWQNCIAQRFSVHIITLPEIIT